MKMIPLSLSRVIAQKGLLLQTHSPAILFGAGVTSMVASTVLACRATLKLDEVLEKAEKDRSVLRIMTADPNTDYEVDEFKKATTHILMRTTFEVGKLYAPAVVLNIAGIAALTQSHNILTKRNAALAAAYTAVDKAFREYRDRVTEKYGEDEDRALRYGTEFYEIETDKGKIVQVERVASGQPSMYARFFDQLCAPWSKDPEVNLIWLRCQQSYLNELLLARGHVFLNEAYDTLGMPRTQAGQVVGWMTVCHGDGDNYIDFGIWKGENQESIDFVNGREGAVLVDFNVDGVIFDKIDTPVEALSWQRG